MYAFLRHFCLHLILNTQQPHFGCIGNKMTALLEASHGCLHKSHDGLETLNLDREIKIQLYFKLLIQ